MELPSDESDGELLLPGVLGDAGMLLPGQPSSEDEMSVVGELPSSGSDDAGAMSAPLLLPPFGSRRAFAD